MTIRTAIGRVVLTLIAGFAHSAEVNPPPGPLQKAMEAAKSGDFATAKKLLAAEAEKGNAEAANGLGEMTLAGRGAKPDPAGAAKWFQKAADAGHNAAMFNLSRLLERGAEGVVENKEKAQFLLQTSAEAGYAPAQLRLALTSEPAPKARADKAKFAEARGWLERAAEQEHPDALLVLVHYYDEGLGGAPFDAQKAAELCFRSAKAGSVVAMNEMAVRYQKGAGVPQDNVAAIGWLTFAAQHDLPAAHVNLGACYENGIGVKQDLDQAGRHYAAAARANFARGEFLLGHMIEEGKGTKANAVHAYVLYARAALHRETDAAKQRDRLGATLTAAQLAEAKKMLAEQTKDAEPATAAGK
jgi:TPR repeat protein